MASCEKCWYDADGNYEEYIELIEERKDNPCSPFEQAGQFWDEKKQIDSRKIK
jgi:hypothetical protein